MPHPTVRTTLAAALLLLSTLAIAQFGVDGARRSAERYLAVAAFSRDGLIDQLGFEGFARSDATAAVDALDVDWNDQAARSARAYLDVASFSRTGLIDQLVFEGFTRAQATYGVDAVTGSNAGDASGAADAAWQDQALASAQQYLAVAPFSRTGLIDQLVFEGFTRAQATYGVDAADVDWNAQAVRAARSYLDVMAFSRSGLIDQLTFEGFTPAQAAYGVDHVGE